MRQWAAMKGKKKKQKLIPRAPISLRKLQHPLDWAKALRASWTKAPTTPSRKLRLLWLPAGPKRCPTLTLQLHAPQLPCTTTGAMQLNRMQLRPMVAVVAAAATVA
jgi:hypothetical protein